MRANLRPAGSRARQPNGWHRAASKVPVIGSFLSALVALGFLALGAGAAVRPRALAAGYGVPADDGPQLAYVRAVGARDAALGLLVLSFLATRSRAPLRAVLGVSALVAASDFALVYGARGKAASPNLAIHGGGFAGLVAAWQLMRPQK
jgi:hypothetical protein